jgi:hypothetical protein
MERFLGITLLNRKMNRKVYRDPQNPITALELPMKKIHLALSTDRIEESIHEYTQRFGAAPCSVVAGEYALWRTEFLNISIRQDATRTPGELRHLGWEDPDAAGFTQETDLNGIVWERFRAEDQAEEINALWPQADYQPK